MKVKEAEHNLAKQFEERISVNPVVTSAVTKRYLESARGHYLSALAGLNVGKQERTKICHNVDAFSVLEDSALDQAAEAEQIPIQGQLGQAKNFTEMDIQIHLTNGVLKACDRKLLGMKLQFNKTLAKSTKEQIAEMISRIGVGQEMEPVNASELEDSITVLPELGGDKESPLKEVIEGSSLQRVVKSLKVELENLKKEHAELKDKEDGGAEFAGRSLHFKLLKSKSEHEGYVANEPKVRQTFERTARDQHEAEDLKIKGEGLKREKETSKVSEEVQKRQRVALYVDEGKEATVSTVDRSKCVSGKIYDASVSTSESSARIMFSEDELESSSQKADKLERGKLTIMKGHVESATYDHSSEFSIRNYVFAARNKDMSMNWPFSKKNLQLCLKHGVKDVLPPFQHMDSLRDSSMKRCFTDTSLHSEESNLGERPLVLKNHLVPGIAPDHRWNQELAEGYRDSESFPSIGEKELAFKTTAAANSQSEVESVSTSNLPLSEVSDERGAAASAVNNKIKSSASQLSSKKCKVAVKFRISSLRGASDDITSACTVPSETMASKICPVCETFSSSSNTTLNAHIDQCLSSQSTPNWIKNSNLIKPRIKPRKIRLMADIYATAPHCTLEDLDRRNGTNWATNTEFPSQDTEKMVTQGKNSGVSSRHVVNNGDDGSVYIDSSGRKIRILSKFNDVSSSSFPKAREDLRAKKQSKLGRTSKFFSPKRKRHLAKHLKYLKVTRQRKRFLSLTVKEFPNEVCGTAEATSTWGEKHLKEQQPAPFLKDQGQKSANASGTSRQWICSKRSNLSKKNESEEINMPCRQASDDLQPGSDFLDTERMHVKKQSSSPKKSFSLRSSVRTRTLCRARTDQKSESICGRKKFCSPSMIGTIRGNRKSCLVPLNSGVVQFNEKEGVPRPMNSTVSPASSLERDVEIQADTVENADSSFTGSRKLSDSSDVLSFEGIRSINSETNMLSHSLSYVHAYQSNSIQKSTALEKPEYKKISDMTDSFGRSSLMKLRRKRESEHRQDGYRDTNRTGGFPDETHDDQGCVRSAITGLHKNREVMTPASSSGFTIGEAVTSLKRSPDPELQKVTDVADPQPDSVQYLDNFQGPLITTEARAHPSQPSLSDDHEMFHGDVVGAERLELKTVGSDFNVDVESSFPEVDPIPIPGPPGSDLPSFSDMGSEDGDDDDVEDLSDSPLSATSTISNLGIPEPIFSEPEYYTNTLPCSSSGFPGWLGAGSGPMVGTSEMFSHIAVTGTARDTSLVDSSKDSVFSHGRGVLVIEGDNQQCSCSRKEGIPWSAALNFEQSQLLGKPTGNHMGCTLYEKPNCLDSTSSVLSFSSCSMVESENVARSSETSYQSIMPKEVATEAAVSFPKPGDCDSASPASILRLMGKDLMVINKSKDDISVQNVCTNRQVLPVSEFPCGVPRSWEHQSPQSMVVMGPLLHEHNPHTFSVQHFGGGSSNTINFRSPKQGSQGSMYGAAPLQR